MHDSLIENGSNRFSIVEFSTLTPPNSIELDSEPLNGVRSTDAQNFLKANQFVFCVPNARRRVAESVFRMVIVRFPPRGPLGESERVITIRRFPD